MLSHSLAAVEPEDSFAETKEELGIVWKPHFPVIEFL